MALLRSSERVDVALVYPDDKAIDTDASNRAAYLDDLSTADTNLVFRKGQAPSRFYVRALLNDQVIDAKARARQGALDSAHANERLQWELATLGLVKIENLYGKGGTLEGQDALDALQTMPDVCTWIGEAIWMLSNASPQADHVRDLLRRGTEAELLLKALVTYADQAEPDEVQSKAYEEALGLARDLLKLKSSDAEHLKQTLDDPKKS